MRSRAPRRTPGSRLAAALFRVALVAAVTLGGNGGLGGREAAAQCVGGCPAAERDAHGCCPKLLLAQPATCSEGKVHPPNAGAPCCWPGQTWARPLGACAGTPTSCPAGLEVEGETCVPVDKDGDGIPNALDKCPLELEDIDGFEDEDGCPDPDNDHDGIPDTRDACPNLAEDFNGFEDADGCPDEPERLARLHAQGATEVARRAGLGEASRLAAATRLGEADAAAAREHEEERLARLAALRLRAAPARSTGWKMVGAGLGSEAAMGVFLGLGAWQSAVDPRSGASAKSLQSAAAAGKALDATAAGFGGLGALFLAVGIPTIVLNREPEDGDVAVVAWPGGVALRGRLP